MDKSSRTYDLRWYQENPRIPPPGIDDPNWYIMRYIFPFLVVLSSIDLAIDKVKDFVGLFKVYSQCGNKDRGSNTKMIGKNDFSAIFRNFFIIIKAENRFVKRVFDKINNFERNIIFTFFAAQFPSLMYQIAKDLPKFGIDGKICKKKEFSEELIKLTDEVQKLKNSGNLMIQSDPFENIHLEELTNFSDQDEPFEFIGTEDEPFEFL